MQIPRPDRWALAVFSKPENGALAAVLVATIFLVGGIIVTVISTVDIRPWRIEGPAFVMGASLSVLGFFASFSVVFISFPLFQLASAAPALLKGISAVQDKQDEIAVRTERNAVNSTEVEGLMVKLRDLVDLGSYMSDLSFSGEERELLTGSLRGWSERLAGLMNQSAEDARVMQLFAKCVTRYFDREAAEFSTRPLELYGNVSLYASILRTTVEAIIPPQNADQHPALRVLVVNNVLPEYWFNWPDSRDPSKRYAVQAIQEYKRTVREHADALRQSGSGGNNYKRITLCSDAPTAQAHGLMTRAALEAQTALMLVPGETDDDEVSYVDDLKARTDLPTYVKEYLPDLQGAQVYFISPREQIATDDDRRRAVPLLQKFVADFHPSQAAASFVQLKTSDVTRYLQEKELPSDFLLVGEASAKDGWFFGVAANIHAHSSLAGISFYFGPCLAELAAFARRLETLSDKEDLRDKLLNLDNSPA